MSSLIPRSSSFLFFFFSFSHESLVDTLSSLSLSFSFLQFPSNILPSSSLSLFTPPSTTNGVTVTYHPFSSLLHRKSYIPSWFNVERREPARSRTHPDIDNLMPFYINYTSARREVSRETSRAEPITLPA